MSREGTEREELRSLELAPRSSAAVVALAGATVLGLAWAVGVHEPSAFVVGALVIAASVGWTIARVARTKEAVKRSIDSVGARLLAWADGRAPERVTPHPMTRELVSACGDLVARLERAGEEATGHRSSAEEADRERLAFLADFSHELRTPLNSILGFAHVLESGAEGPLGPDGVEAIGIIVASGEQLRALVEDVLDLTSLETGSLELSPRPVDLGEAAAEVTLAARSLASQKALTIELVEKHVFAMGDEKRLRRILWNLLSRAIRVTEREPVRVVVEKRRDPDRAAFYVEDRGKPLTPLEREALSKGVLDEATTREGVGIGLAVGGRLVRRLVGRIEITALAPGTRVAVELRLATPEELAWADKSRPSMRGGEPEPESRG